MASTDMEVARHFHPWIVDSQCRFARLAGWDVSLHVAALIESLSVYISIPTTLLLAI